MADLYVDNTAGPGGDGSIGAPFQTIAAAIAALAVSPTTIHVATGTGTYDEHGLSLAVQLANKTVRIEGTGAASVIITNTDADDAVILPTNVAGADVTISDAALKIGAALYACVFFTGTWPSTSKLTLENVIFDLDSKANARPVNMQPSSAGGGLVLRNCSITNDTGGAASIYVKNLNLLELDTVLFGSTLNATGVYLLEGMGYVNVHDCTFDRTTKAFAAIAPGLACAAGGKIRLADNIVSGTYLLQWMYGVGGSGNNYDVVIEGNEYTRYGAATSIWLGRDKPWSSHDSIGQVIIRRNTFETAVGATGSHLLEIGGGCPRGLVEDNAFIDVNAGAAGSYLVVTKSPGVVVRRNKMYGSRGLYLVSAQGCVVDHNTIHATDNAAGSWAVKWAGQQLSHSSGTVQASADLGDDVYTVTLEAGASTEDGYFIGAIFTIGGESAVCTAYTSGRVATLARWNSWRIEGLTSAPGAVAYAITTHDSVAVNGNTITNNILVADGANTYCLDDGSDEACGNLVDHNIYWTVNSGVLATYNGTPRADMAALRDAWGTGNVSELNDDNSDLADPLLANPAGAIFTIAPSSPAFLAASDGGSIGAEQLDRIPVALGCDGGFNG
jgi:hypothetical protein